MRRTLFLFSFLSLLSGSCLYSEPSATAEPVELFSLEEQDIAPEELSSLEKEISASDEGETAIETGSSLPEISTKIPTAQDASEPALFSSLEHNSSLPLTDIELLNEPSSEMNAQAVASPIFAEDAAFEEIPEEMISTGGIQISLSQVFGASPFIYGALLLLSLASITIWLYSMSRLKFQGSISPSFKAEIQSKLQERRFQEALTLCQSKQSLLTQIMASAISSYKHGFPFMQETMKSEGKRATISFWQKLGLLQDIAVIAPMLGLLGTVLGMFYAFYDLNRSFESVSNLFDGFGIAVGTTVAGIVVAILAMILQSIVKFRLVQCLSRVENEATCLVRFFDDHQQP
ncbi:MAG: MotA/TolQ/ExbB proton channel family protein [Rhabdochlamydiaceae bacterium]|nr:MotA/TolQ/ExbB proton channel family protein [Rhabdochlamydiaceae bacterium]